MKTHLPLAPLPQNSLEPWNIKENEYPVLGSPIEKLRFMLGYAVLAPSFQNAQPWLWKEEGGALSLYYDPSRVSPGSQPDHRQILISCGAALAHLWTAIQYFGYAADIEYFPDKSDADLLARIRLGSLRPPTSEDESLFRAIPRRHTNRGLFQTRHVSANTLSDLEKVVTKEGAWVKFLEKHADREALVNLIVRGDTQQWQSKPYCRDYAHWVRDESDSSCDGIPAAALGFNSVETRLLPMAMRQPIISRIIKLGNIQADRDWLLAGGAPILGVVGTAKTCDSRRDYLSVGEALSRMLLMGCSEGLAFSFFNSPVEMLNLWPEVFKVINHRGFLHLIFRLGYPLQESDPTPRRARHEVLM